VYANERVGDEQGRELEAEDIAARVKLAAMAQERKDAQEKSLDEAMTPILKEGHGGERSDRAIP
jgi:hypothetical protein